MLKSIEHENNVVHDVNGKELKVRCTQLEKRLKEIEKFMSKLYEEFICSGITDQRYNLVNDGYEMEVKELKEELKAIKFKVANIEDKQSGGKKFIKLIEK